MMGLPTFATLINNKIVVPNPTSDHFAVDRHFFKDCMADALGKVPVDEAWYLAAYPDVGVALSTGVVPNCKAHFVHYGFYEHRMPYKIVVDEPWYLRVYPDIGRAVELKNLASGQFHFDRFGYREGRLPYANFSLS